MAAELFATFADFKFFVGGRANQSLELDSIAPTIYETARRHITPALSESEYQILVEASPPSAAQTALLPFVKRALAILTMFEYSKVASVEVGESGMHRVETESRKSVYRYQEKAYQDDAREKGYDALELLLKFLSDNAATYTGWAATDEAKRHREPLLNYASTFRMQTDYGCDRFTFEALRPIISSVQMFGVEQQLPTSFWSGFISRHVAGTLTTQEKNLRGLMQKAIAHKALEEAMMQHWIKVREGRVYLLEEYGEQNQHNKTSPSGNLASLSQRNILWADRYTCAWKQYIIDNKASFPTVFDVASGGTSASANAWHINTEAEATEATEAAVEQASGAVFLM